MALAVAAFAVLVVMTAVAAFAVFVVHVFQIEHRV
jgi:hypothetical protein